VLERVGDYGDAERVALGITDRQAHSVDSY
jgi:hypothetical protein